MMCALGAVFAAVSLAQPAITSVVNSASYTPAGLPNAGIAQGSLFVIKGSNLGPANVVVAQSYPLLKTLAGTSVSVTVGGKTVDAIMYYTLATQVAAILPSGALVGTGTVTVTYNGQTSASAPILVVQNNFAMFTVNQGGTGDAIAFLNSDNGLITFTHAANPGDLVVIWGTGLGPVAFDESMAAVQTDMTNVPVEAFIGGKTATVRFRGRNACCSSVDTIYVEVPQGVAGCITPVAIKIGNFVSNTGTIAVAASGRTCTTTSGGLTSGDIQRLLGKGQITAGGIALSRSVSTTAGIGGFGGGTQRTDTGGGSFVRFNATAVAAVSSAIDVAAYGSCTVSTFSGQNPNPLANLPFQFLDAGPSIGVNGPNGPKTMNKSTTAGLIVYSGQFDNTATYLSAGQYMITGTGGADIGAFNATLTLPPPLTWTDEMSITTVTRANGVTVHWNGGDPAGYVQITGTSFAGTSAANTVGAIFTCTARTSDGSFTVPPVVLLLLPPSGMVAGFTLPGTLAVSSVSTPVQFQASGLDYGAVTSSVINSNSVTYQ